MKLKLNLFIAAQNNAIMTNYIKGYYRPMSRVFGNGPEDRGSIPRRVISNMVLDAALLNTQQYKVKNKGKVEQSSKWSSALSYTTV